MNAITAGVLFSPAAAEAKGTTNASEEAQQVWKLGEGKSATKWANRMQKRGWTPAGSMGSGRNTARATLGREFPTCTLSVCAAGS